MSTRTHVWIVNIFLFFNYVKHARYWVTIFIPVKAFCPCTWSVIVLNCSTVLELLLFGIAIAGHSSDFLQGISSINDLLALFTIECQTWGLFQACGLAPEWTLTCSISKWKSTAASSTLQKNSKTLINFKWFTPSFYYLCLKQDYHSVHTSHSSIVGVWMSFCCVLGLNGA